MKKDTGVIDIHGKQYHTVGRRVQDFREAHGDMFGIWTDVVQNDGQLVVMSARIVDKETGFVVAMGHAEEDRSKGQINRTSALENCETSAIGRALAAFGLAGTEYASANEVENAMHQQREPKQGPPPVITDGQHTELVGLFASTNTVAKPYLERAAKNTGAKVADLRDLPASEFEALRNHLQGKMKEKANA